VFVRESERGERERESNDDSQIRLV